jgi:hypothetical protein
MRLQPRTIPAILTSNFFVTQPGSQQFVTEATEEDEQALYSSMTHALVVLVRGAFAARAHVQHAAPLSPARDVQLDKHFANLWMLLSLALQPAQMMCTDPDNLLEYGDQWFKFCQEILVGSTGVMSQRQNNYTTHCAFFLYTEHARHRLPSVNHYIALAERFDSCTACKKRNALIIIQRILCLIVGKALPYM